MDVLDFLPKYPSISEEDFNDQIFAKKEFEENRLEKIEKIPLAKGELMRHQITIARFLSTRTPYNAILLAHQMGTGKTCSSIGAIEQIRYEPNSTFTGAIILASGDGILNNFTNELEFKCTSGEYIPDNYNTLSSGEKAQRTRKMYEDYYQRHTFVKFARSIEKSTDAMIVKYYSNKIVVIDEVHNLRSSSANDNPYGQLHRFLHLIRNSKIILMSGTPMMDTPEEIADVMNLILPSDEQLPSPVRFLSEYLRKEADSSFSIKKDKVAALKEKFKGRTSFLKTMPSEVKITYEGELRGALTHIKVVSLQMGKFQAQSYDTSYQSDIGSNVDLDDVVNKKGIYDKSRQSAVFVLPDNKPVFNDQSASKSSGEQVKKYALTDSFKKMIINGDKLENVRKYSVKFATIIEKLLKNDGRSSFVYSWFVKGSGVILFSLILELFGFAKATGNDVGNSPRYALITGLNASTEIRRLIDRFNQPDNMHGDVIKVLIGSSAISEGFSISNIQNIFVINPDWHYAQLEQAINRGLRLGSHNDLIKAGIVPDVRVYQYVVLETQTNPSIDQIMYERCQVKDKSIQRILRLIKEASVDCELNFARNSVSDGVENGRDCEYQTCDYKCDAKNNKPPSDLSTYQLYYTTTHVHSLRKKIMNILREDRHITFAQLVNKIGSLDERDRSGKMISVDTEFRVKVELRGMPGSPNDFTTPDSSWMLHYDDYKKLHLGSIDQRLFEAISELFRVHFALDYATLKNLIGKTLNVRDFQLLFVLERSIRLNSRFRNKYGRVSYLREDHNLYFLVETISFEGTSLQGYYAKNPVILAGQNYENLVAKLYTESLPKLANSLCEADNTDDKVFAIIRAFPIELQNDLLEGSIRAVELGRDEKRHLRDLIIQFFSGYVKKTADSFISTFLPDRMRCFDSRKKIWIDCPENVKASLEEQDVEHLSQLEHHKFGWYGLINPSSGAFCLKETKETEATRVKEQNAKRISAGKAPLKPDDKRCVAKGKQCTSMNKNDMAKLRAKASKLFKIDFTGKNTSDTCSELQKLLVEKSMTVNDSSCGSYKKVSRRT